MASGPSAEFVSEVYQAGIPCVEIGSGYGHHLIHPDNEGGIDAAIAHLVALGHRRIVHWRGAGENYASVHRHKGFVAAAERHQLSAKSTLVARSQEEIRVMLRLSSGQRPTGIVAYNDYQACLSLDIAREIGLRVPDDLSVVGFDDNILAEAARPQLTTIHNPLGVQAEAAITLLQALWRGEKPEIPAPVPTQLIIRQSTGSAP
jgi:LacI family transcriptional regulator